MNAGAAPEQWIDDTADDGEALCQPEDMSPSVEYVRWSNRPVQELAVNWEGQLRCQACYM